jgi:glycosyltransferase involved in cell wall biosynthesis
MGLTEREVDLLAAPAAGPAALPSLPPKVPVSVVVISKDEEPNIERCLKSVSWAEELIVVDAYSRDRTIELAEGCGARVVQREWPGYSPQKNYGIGLADQPWILSLDADEVVSPTLAAEIGRTLATDPPFTAYRIFRPTYFLGRPLRHYGRAPRDPGQVRLFRQGSARFADRRVHESLEVNGSIGTLQGPMPHYSYPTPALRNYWRKIHRYAAYEAQDRAANGTRLGNRWTRAAGKVAWMFIWRRGLLDGPRAWIWIVGQAYQEWLITGAASRLRRQERLHAGS